MTEYKEFLMSKINELERKMPGTPTAFSAKKSSSDSRRSDSKETHR